MMMQMWIGGNIMASGDSGLGEAIFVVIMLVIVGYFGLNLIFLNPTLVLIILVAVVITIVCYLSG